MADLVASRGIDSDPDEVPERWSRDGGVKYEWVEHGERNAIYNAARNGVSVRGATMYLNYAVECCCDCTRAIIQSGIKRVVGPDRSFPGKGNGTSYNTGSIARDMMDGVDMEVEHVDMGMADDEWLTYIPEDERA
jgi:dCMP deaminase